MNSDKLISEALKLDGRECGEHIGHLMYGSRHLVRPLTAKEMSERVGTFKNGYWVNGWPGPFAFDSVRTPQFGACLVWSDYRPVDVRIIIDGAATMEQRTCKDLIVRFDPTVIDGSGEYRVVSALDRLNYWVVYNCGIDSAFRPISVVANGELVELMISSTENGLLHPGDRIDVFCAATILVGEFGGRRVSLWSTDNVRLPEGFVCPAENTAQYTTSWMGDERELIEGNGPDCRRYKVPEAGFVTEYASQR